MCVCAHTHPGIMWKSEDNFQKSLFFIHHVDLQGPAQAVSPSSKHPDLMSHLTSPSLLLRIACVDRYINYVFIF